MAVPCPKRSKLSMLSDWDTFCDPSQAGKQHLNWFQLSQLPQFAGFWKEFYGKEFSSSQRAGCGLCGLCSQCCRSQCLGSHSSVRDRSRIWSQMEPRAPGTARLSSQAGAVSQQSTNLTFSQVPRIWARARGQSLQVKGAKHRGGKSRVHVQ